MRKRVRTHVFVPMCAAHVMFRYNRCNACFSHHLRVRALEHLGRLKLAFVTHDHARARALVGTPTREKKTYAYTDLHTYTYTPTLQSRSLMPMSNAFAIVCLVTSIYAIVATSFFAGARPDNYGSFFISFFSMFQAITGDNWWVFAGFRLFAGCTPRLPLCISPLNLGFFQHNTFVFEGIRQSKSTGLLMCEQWMCVRAVKSPFCRSSSRLNA